MFSSAGVGCGTAEGMDAARRDVESYLTPTGALQSSVLECGTRHWHGGVAERRSRDHTTRRRGRCKIPSKADGCSAELRTGAPESSSARLRS